MTHPRPQGGNQEVQAARWSRIQEARDGRVIYVSQYARAVLAAARAIEHS